MYNVWHAVSRTFQLLKYCVAFYRREPSYTLLKKTSRSYFAFNNISTCHCLVIFIHHHLLFLFIFMQVIQLFFTNEGVSVWAFRVVPQISGWLVQNTASLVPVPVVGLIRAPVRERERCPTLYPPPLPLWLFVCTSYPVVSDATTCVHDKYVIQNYIYKMWHPLTLADVEGP